MTSVRDAFFDKVYNLVKQGEDIYIITADLGAPSLDAFRQDFPERYISVGIAEQNLITVAAGMALAGKKVIAYGLNPFPIVRAFDQIRCLMAELKIPITVCALNAGICAAECGFTHMPIEDMAMLRTLSNIEVYNPTDETISVQLACDVVNRKVPKIVRFDKTLRGKIYNINDVNFDKGFTCIGNTGHAKVGIITNGMYTKELNAAIASGKLTDGKLIDLYKLPVDEKALCKEIDLCDHIITIEENVKLAGLGSMILEILSDNGIVKKVLRYGLNMSDGYYDVFTSRDYIRMDQKIDIDSVLLEIKKLMD